MSIDITTLLQSYQDRPHAVLIDRNNASVYHIARYMLGEINDRPLLPATVEDIVNATFKEGWFIQSFYYESIANLIHVQALQFQPGSDRIVPGDAYESWIQRVIQYREQQQIAAQNYENRAKMMAEGKQLVLDSLIPQPLWNRLESYPHKGIAINTNNFKKRIQVGAQVYVELGKRHFTFESKITKKRETISGNFYVLGEITAVEAKTFQVKVQETEMTLEHYRATKVLTGL